MNIAYLLFASYVLALLIKLFYYLIIFCRFVIYKRSPETKDQQYPVSIIVCAKNEAENLLEYLPLILEQDYPNFEVVAINDSSVDDTEDVLKAFKKKYPHLKIVTVKESNQFWGSKKYALTLGIKAASYEHLLFTDADCLPTSKQWLNNMASHFSTQTEIVLGFGGYEKQNGLLNKIIRFDTFQIAMHYFSYALIGKPYMGVGRNLAYSKSLFFRHKGFAAHQHIASGDDDLFINSAATKFNTQIEIHTDSHTLSKPKTTFKAWWKQKNRHLTTAKHYKLIHKILLGLLPLSQYASLGLLIVLLFMQYQIYLILSLFFIVFIVKYFVTAKSMIKLNEKDLLLLSPFYELILMFLYPFLILSTLINKRKQWKN